MFNFAQITWIQASTFELLKIKNINFTVVSVIYRVVWRF